MRSRHATSAHRRFRKGWELSRSALESLLEALHADRDQAGRRYEKIRRKLIFMFEHRGLRFAEDLADEAINRVARKIEDGLKIKNLDAYFHRVASLLAKEGFRFKARQEAMAVEIREWPRALPSPEQEDQRLARLRACLRRLSEEERALVLRYHRVDKQDRIRARKRLAEELGIPVGALRLRVYRIRQRLERAMLGKASPGRPAPVRSEPWTRKHMES